MSGPDSSAFLPFPDGIIIQAVTVAESSLVVKIACAFSSDSCPLCGQASERIHGAYARTVADLPCAGRRVILEYTVRKFVCCTDCCLRKIFTERRDGLVQSYARMMNRLVALVQAVGLVGGGERRVDWLSG